MHRTFVYVAAIAGMATVFTATLVVAALVLGATGRASGEGAPTPSASDVGAADGAGEITITAFDLGPRGSEST